MKTITIGRSKSNVVVLDDISVSKSHAILEMEDNGMRGVLKDLNSTNGTFVNNSNKRLVGSIQVSLTDVVRFGTATVTIKELLAKSEKTVVRKVNDPNRYSIGKSADNQIVINHEDVSRIHAVLYKDEQGRIIIEDRNSTNGTYVNGLKVNSKILQQGDKVTITRNYPLAWEHVFGTSRSNIKPKPVMPILKLVAVILVILVLCGGGYMVYYNLFSWDKEKIYKEYHSAVCWVYVQYGYQIYLDGEEFTPTLCKLLEMPANDYLHFENGKLRPGFAGAEGTAFFISEDGKLATNLHISRPWLFDNDKEKLEKATNKLIGMFVAKNPSLSRSVVEVKGVLKSIHIIPDGLPLSESNFEECEEIHGHDDVNKDVAILQTKSRKLPVDVKKVIDINDADITEETLTEGREIFTIGFPYGVGLAMDSKKDLKNQVHDGSVTQNRGDYEFGHDAATAGGASGSPILSNRGKLIGVHHAGMTGVTGAQGFNMAIKAKYVQELLK